MSPSLDVDLARASFPALTGEWTYMDNAGGSQCLRSVVDRIGDYLLNCNVQHGASYEPSVRAGERLASAQAAVGEWLGAREPAEVVFGPSTTQLLANLAASFRKRLQPGDEVVITDLDHEANAGPWKRLAESGVTVRTWKVDRESLRLRAQDLEPLLGPRTRLVCFSAVSNVLGTIHPVRELVERIHAHGALACVDAVAHAPHRLVESAEWDADFVTVSAYKTYGPHLAVMVGRRSLLEELPGISHFFIGESEVPYKFQPGGANYELADSTREIVSYLASLGQAESLRERLRSAFEAIAAHEEMLAERLLSFLRSRPSVSLWGEPSADAALRVPTVSFTVAGRSSSSITEHLDAHLVGARFGHFYAHALVERLGLPLEDGVVRVSLVHYNTPDEVDRLTTALSTVT